MIALLAGSVALVFWYEALDPVDDATSRRALEWLDLGLVAFFLLEWLWRVRQSGAGARSYALRYSWELLGMVPLLLPLPAFLRALRLLRIVRILRVFETVGKTLGAWERIAREGSLHKIALVGGGVTFVGALLVWALERDAPGSHIADFSTALWWAIVTVTTVGYGDITPVTTMGRFVAAILMVTGIGTIGLLASTLASVLVPQRSEGPSPAPAPAGAGGLSRELHELAALHDAGKLTDEEFAAAKARALGRP